MSRRILEYLKTAVIAVLLMSILLLFLMALPTGTVSRMHLPGFLASFLGVPELPTVQNTDQTRHTAAASPVLLSINQAAGRSSIRRDPDAMEQAFLRFGTFLRTGLSTAGEGVAYTGDWNFLDAPGVMFYYDGSIPARALCHWLDGSAGTVADVCSGFVLNCEDGSVFLYTVADSGIRRYTTDVSFSALLSVLNEYTPDGTEFAYSRQSSTVSPLTLWESSVTVPNCTASNPLTVELSRKLAASLDFNPYGTGTYTDPTGSTTYTESDRSLTVSPDGSVLFAVSGDGYTRFRAASSSAADLIDAAGVLLDAVLDSTPGDAVLSLCEFIQEDELTRLSYRFSVGGVPVYPVCAEVTFLGTEFADLRCTLRTFSLQNSHSTLLPLTQASAIAEPGKRLFPAYDLFASGTAKAGWLAK